MDSGDRPQEIHTQLLAAAANLSVTLQSAIERNGPLVLSPNQERPFAERLCRAVAGQQLSVQAAKTIWGRVVDSVPDTETLIAYVARVEPLALKACGLSGAKVKTVSAIAEAALNRQLEVDELSELSAIERTERLTKIWGIGQWTADMMNIFYFGDEDIWPEGDVTARKTLERLTSKRRKTVRTAQHFRPYRSYLALHAWRSADTTILLS